MNLKKLLLDDTRLSQTTKDLVEEIYKANYKPSTPLAKPDAATEDQKQNVIDGQRVSTSKNGVNFVLSPSSKKWVRADSPTGKVIVKLMP